MGRFASTVGLYERLRPPYPPEFFAAAAEKLKLSKGTALIDLGTGPGLLALGFAPYVGRLVGVDPEPRMLEAASEAAARAGVTFELIPGRAEDLPESIGRFDLVTIGRALHWMDERAIGGLFDRLVAPDGAVIVCASFSTQDGRNAWLDDYSKARRAWSEPKLWTESRSGGRAHRELASLLQGSGFSVTETIRVEATHEVSVGDLAQRTLTFSSSSPAVVGDKVEALLRDVEARLAPFSHDGRVREIFVAAAQVVKRTG
ncbi:MAG: class I SAM-dependent methyltransferase [Bradyrhizobium sp.]|uniref:class I SAM-dependent methyltransferase n=1 Tax=Bradyrhizobium sp. TaxID=376 RepID=UPI001DEBF21D|nr:class I SAM-dependent methyltransferase [Bradyrhizobium sp.]MBV9563557.1 class I SAM-dependent methyltransferase [Bradyrhizobium sp.]